MDDKLKSPSPADLLQKKAKQPKSQKRKAGGLRDGAENQSHRPRKKRQAETKVLTSLNLSPTNLPRHREMDVNKLTLHAIDWSSTDTNVSGHVRPASA